MNNYSILDSTINALRSFEGVKYTAYKDSAGRWTIGVGHLIRPQEGYLMNAPINDLTVNALLRQDAKIAADAVNRLVHVELRQSQFDALVSFTFNLGSGALTNSSLLRDINAGVPVIEKLFTDWDKVHIDGKLEEVEGLKERREKEYQMFIS